MEQPVSLHAAQFLLAGGLGAALGLFYDLLRAVRRIRPRTVRILDALFCAALLPSLLLFALYPGRGQFRLFFYPGIFLGAAIYFLTLSPLVLRLLAGVFRILGSILRTVSAPPANFIQKNSKYCKKYLFNCGQIG